MKHNWKPSRIITVLVGLFLQPFVFLYVNRPRLFFLYLVLIAFLYVGIYYYPDNLYFALSGLVIIIICIVHGYKIAQNYDVAQKRGWYARWWIVPAGFLMPIIIVRVVFFDYLSIPAASMSPYINPGNTVFISKIGFNNYRILNFEIYKSAPTDILSRGEIVVFQKPDDLDTLFIKRIIGLPGEKVIMHDHKISIENVCQELVQNCTGKIAFNLVGVAEKNVTPNGFMTYNENHSNLGYEIFLHPDSQFNNGIFEWTVPDSHYFVLGDSRDNSNDSRYIGTIPEENIVGKLIAVW